MAVARSVFWVFAPISIGSAIAMLLQRNAVHAALFLVVNFFTIAVFYLVLGRVVPVRRADHRVRRRDHGAVPVRDHAARRRPRGAPGRAAARPAGDGDRARRRGSRSSSSWRSARASGSPTKAPANFDETVNRGGQRGGARRVLFRLVLLPLRGDVRAADRRGDRRGACSASRQRRAITRAEAASTPPARRRCEDADRLLPGGLRDAVHDRDGRRAGPQERARDLHVGRAPAERRQPVARRVQPRCTAT